MLEKTPDLNVPFETEIKVQAGELEFGGSMKRYGSGIWELKADSPETLAGLEITYNDEGVKAVLDGLELEVPMEDINSTAVFALMFKAIDSAAAADKLTCTDTEDGKKYAGEFAGRAYTVTFDPVTLYPTALEIPSAGICAELKNFHVLTGETTVTETVTE